MDERYYAAFLSLSKHRVCGRDLRPFSLRHRLVLSAIGSPLLPGSTKQINPSDLIVAARVCSIPDPFEATGGRSMRDVLRLALYSLRPRLYYSDLGAWRDYLLDTAQHPVMAGKKDANKRDRGVDWTLNVALSLIGMGFTEEEAWTMPEGRAMFYFVANAIRNGADVEIVTTEQQEKLPLAREAVEKAIAEANARLAAGGKAGKPKRS